MKEPITFIRLNERPHAMALPGDVRLSVTKNCDSKSSSVIVCFLNYFRNTFVQNVSFMHIDPCFSFPHAP